MILRKFHGKKNGNKVKNTINIIDIKGFWEDDILKKEDIN